MEDAMARTLSDNERPRLVCDLEKNLHGPDFSKLNFEHPAPDTALPMTEDDEHAKAIYSGLFLPTIAGRNAQHDRNL